MNAPKVVVRRGDAVDEYPLPLPFVPTYREMNLIEDALEKPIPLILMYAGISPVYDAAVAIYAVARERGREFGREDAADLLDLSTGQIEVHYVEADDPEVSAGDPLPESGGSASVSDSAAETPSDLPSSTSETPEAAGTP